MNLKLAGALVAATAAISVLAGCPMGTPNVTPTAAPTFEFDAASLLTGKVTYDGGKVEYADPNYTQQVEVKEAGATNRLTVKAPLQEGMYFQFKDLTAGKAYQAIIDYTGAEPTKAEDVNAIRLYVSAPATASTTATDPMLSFDLEWVLNPSPGFNATSSVPVAFSFSAIQNLEAEYQVRVATTANSTVWSSAWGTGTSVSWNGKEGTETNTPGGTAAAAGKYKYQVKFRKKGGTYGGANVYGETQLIPFNLTL